MMGLPKVPILSALGDPVNTAARLESATNELNTSVVVSQETLHATGLTIDESCHELVLRGRMAALPVYALSLKDLRMTEGSHPVS